METNVISSANGSEWGFRGDISNTRLRTLDNVRLDKSPWVKVLYSWFLVPPPHINHRGSTLVICRERASERERKRERNGQQISTILHSGLTSLDFPFPILQML